MFSLPRPTTDQELAEAIERYLGIRLPDTVVVPGHSTPFRAVADAFFARSPVAVWYGARALAGKTFALAVLGWLEAVLLQASVSILGGSQDQSMATQEYMHQFWRSPTVPLGILDGKEPGAITTRLRWGNKIRALAASQTMARGGHPERLRIDECDDLKWSVYQAVMGQPMSRGDVLSQTVICSTMQNQDGTMSKVLKLAAERGWTLHRWGYQETLEPHGWLTQAQVNRKRGEMTAESWRVEVELGEPSVEDRAIFTDKVERMFIGTPIAGDGTEFGYREFEPPVAGAHYATGADWARTRDYVEIVTFRDDVLPLRLVAYQRFRRRPTPYIVHAFEHQTERYPGDALHDSTSLGGKIMDDLVATDEWSADKTVSGFDFGKHRARQQMFTDFIIAIEAEEVVSPRIEVLYNQFKFVRNEDLRPGGNGHPPDGFVAGAMAHQAGLASAAGGPLRLLNAGPQAPPKQNGNGYQAPSDGLGRALGFLGGNGNRP